MTRDNIQPAAKRKYPGRRYLLLGGLAVIAGPVIYSVQMLNHSLIAAWYFPVLATLGALLMAWSFVKSRTIVRGIAIVFSTLFAGMAWLVVYGMATPPYTGPVTVGQAFPGFNTKLASGAPFQQGDLKGEQDTVLVFFRGRW